MTAIARATRELVLERDQHCCVSCGRHVDGWDGYSIHHRIPRGMGGSRDPRLDLPSNLLTLHGSGTTGCHGFVESRRALAQLWGYLVHRHLDPAQTPVYTATGWTYFHDDGFIHHPPPLNVSGDKIRELARDVERAREQRMRGAA